MVLDNLIPLAGRVPILIFNYLEFGEDVREDEAISGADETRI